MPNHVVFWSGVEESFCTDLQPNLIQTSAVYVCSHGTISVAVKPLYDIKMLALLLIVHLEQSMPP
jgi:hypothetical protein